MEANSTGSPSGVDQSEGLVKQRKRDGSSSSTRQSRPRQSSTGEENKVNGTNDGSGRPASTKTIAIITDGSHSVKTIIGPPSKPYSDSELSSSWSTSLHDPSSLPNSPASSKTTKSADSTVDVTTSSSSDIGGKGTVSLKISAKESPDSLSPDAGVLIERKDGNSRIEKKSTKVLKGEARTSVSKKPPSPSATAVDLTNLKMAPKSLQTNYPTNLEGKPPAETRTAPAVAKKLKPPPPSSPDPKVVAQTAKSTSNLKAPPPVSSVTKAKPSAILNDPSPSQQAVPTASSASAARLPPSSESRKSSRSVQAPLPPTKSSENQPGTRTPDTTKSCSSSVASSLSDASRQESASQRRSTTNNKLAAMEAAVQETVVGRASSKSLPGAYLVQGSNMELARAGVLTSPRNETLSTVNGVNTTSTPFVATGNEIHATLVVENEDVESGDSNGNRKPTTKKKKSRKASKSDTNNSVVVASELTDDIEATIEREVQRRLLEQTTKAHLVSIDHGNHRILPPAEEEKRIAELKDVYRPKGVREKLFGDVRQSVDIAASPECIRKREYLQWSVKRNPTTAQWVASVMTNQRAMQEGDTIEMELSKVSYSAATQQEAYETGLANATPMMHSLGENPICFICKAKFAVFRRGCNCRNCGVCVCSACTTSWPAKMLPDTYLTKKDKAVVPGTYIFITAGVTVDSIRGRS